MEGTRVLTQKQKKESLIRSTKKKKKPPHLLRKHTLNRDKKVHVLAYVWNVVGEDMPFDL